MKKYQNSLLAGVAALALIAGTGLACAQQSNEHMGGSKGASPQAGQSMSRQGTQPQAQEKSTGTQNQAQERVNGAQTQAQEKGNANRTGHEAGNNMGKRGNAQAERMNGGSKNTRQNTAERQRTLKGLRGDASKPMQSEQGAETKGKASNQAKKSNTTNPAQKGNASNQAEKGNTSNQAQQRNPANETRGSGANNAGAQANGGARVEGANVQLTEQQRTQIRQTIIDSHSAPRVSHVDFDVRIGTVVPRGSIHFVPVPETLVQIEPRWRGYEYFVYEDEVVIIDPSNMTIVVIINA
jgi:Protein of unknown function (DUF1236)